MTAVVEGWAETKECAAAVGYEGWGGWGFGSDLRYDVQGSGVWDAVGFVVVHCKVVVAECDGDVAGVEMEGVDDSVGDVVGS